MKYIIIEYSNIKDLSKGVNFWLDYGYIPVGGVSISSYSAFSKTYHTYAQAMIKKEIE